MAKKTKSEALETRYGILNAAIDVFFEKGVSQSTLDDIAGVANVTRGAIYHHFKNKKDLLFTIHENLHTSLTEEFVERLQMHARDPLEALEQFCTDIIKRMQRDSLFLKTLSIFSLKCDYSGDLTLLMDVQNKRTAEALVYVTQAFAEASAKNLLSPAIKPEAVALSFYCFIQGIVLCRLKTPELVNDLFATNAVRVYVHSLRKNPA